MPISNHTAKVSFGESKDKLITKVTNSRKNKVKRNKKETDKILHGLDMTLAIIISTDVS